MKIITKKEFIDWIMKQPNDREVDMDNNTSNDRCGCLMVQFAKEKFNTVGEIVCSFSYFYENDFKIAEFENFCIRNLVTSDWNERTFGEIKQVLIDNKSFQ